MRRFIGGRGAVVGVLLLVLLAGLGGCTAPGSSQAATATTAQPDRVAVWRELIRCIRANGMPNLPDPQFDQNGEPQFPGGNPAEPPERARRACEHIHNRLPPSPRREETQTTADAPTLLRFGRCMREHGLADFPDPGSDGVFRLGGTNARRELYGVGAQKGPQSPRAVAAMEACGMNGDLRGKIFLDVG